jgi:osmotically-inducible protein OsmY
MGLLGQIDGGRGFGEELMSDQSLQQVVLSGLFAEPRINATYIEVTASEGIVRLAGHVERHLEKWLAKLTAAHVSGVRAVTEEIEVRFPRSALTDDETVGRALYLLSLDVAIPPDRLFVSFENGWITLTGELDTPYQKNAAEMDVCNLRGVLGVTNKITLSSTVWPGDIGPKVDDA